jgi:hypothetical protein
LLSLGRVLALRTLSLALNVAAPSGRRLAKFMSGAWRALGSPLLREPFRNLVIVIAGHHHPHAQTNGTRQVCARASARQCGDGTGGQWFIAQL